MEVPPHYVVEPGTTYSASIMTELLLRRIGLDCVKAVRLNSDTKSSECKCIFECMMHSSQVELFLGRSARKVPGYFEVWVYGLSRTDIKNCLELIGFKRPSNSMIKFGGRMVKED